jgi:chromate transport protein ChrA
MAQATDALATGEEVKAADADHIEPCTLRQVVLYFLRLGTVGFGGPIALAGYMQRDLVEARRWISEQDYKEGLALAQLAPGPREGLAALRPVRGERGGDRVDRVRDRLGLRGLGIRRDARRGTATPAQGSAPMGLLPWWMLTGLHGPAAAGTLWTIAWYFTEAGAFVFGSGLAIVPFLHGGVVERFHWLNDRQFLDAVAVAMITPGPVVITVAFIGYLVAGLAGAVVAALGTFLPCYLFTVIPAPHFRRLSKNKSIKAFVDGVTAAATGAIAGAAFVLGRRALFDLPTVLICAATLLTIIKVKKLPEPVVILAAGAVGLALHQALGVTVEVPR